LFTNPFISFEGGDEKMFLSLKSAGFTGIKLDGLGAGTYLGETPDFKREFSVLDGDRFCFFGSARTGSSSAWIRFP